MCKSGGINRVPVGDAASVGAMCQQTCWCCRGSKVGFKPSYINLSVQHRLVSMPATYSNDVRVGLFGRSAGFTH